MRRVVLLLLAALSAIVWAQPTVKVSFSDGGDFDIQGGARMSTCPPNRCACEAGGVEYAFFILWSEPVQARWGNPGCHSTAFSPGNCATAPSPCGANQFPSGYFQSGLGYDSISTGDGVTIPNNGQKCGSLKQLDPD